MAQSGTTEKRSPWPYLIGLILIIIVLYYIIRGLGPDTIYVTKMSGVSFAAGKTFQELMKRPNIVPADATAIERQASTIAVVDITLGEGGPGGQSARVYYGS